MSINSIIHIKAVYMLPVKTEGSVYELVEYNKVLCVKMLLNIWWQTADLPQLSKTWGASCNVHMRNCCEGHRVRLEVRQPRSLMCQGRNVWHEYIPKLGCFYRFIWLCTFIEWTHNGMSILKMLVLAYFTILRQHTPLCS